MIQQSVKRYLKCCLFLLILILAANDLHLYAQEETSGDLDEETLDEEMLEEFRKMSLEEILKAEISVASWKPLSVYDSPGIVTLITRDDIRNCGARDLIDVLTLLVPGFNFQQSKYGPVGINVRGLWAFEGKTLMLIDGVECNDEAFAGIMFGNHYLPDNIERIEIIRGPGSVSYGEHAALGVIHIITRDYNKLHGGYLSGQYSQMYESYSHRNLSFGAGGVYKGLGMSLTGYMGEGKLSDRTLVEYYEQGETDERIQVNPLSLNLNLNYKGLNFRGIYNRYSTVYNININSETYNFQLKYDLKLSDKFSINAKVTQKIQYPWKIMADDVIDINGQYYDTLFSNQKKVSKQKALVSFIWDIHPNLSFTSGIEYTHSYGKVDKYTKGYWEIPYGLNKYEITFRGLGIYSQLMLQNRLFNLTVAGRYDYSEDFGGSFVPRIALTRKFNKFHLKAMVSQSFRLPGGAYYGSDLKPEKATNYELEAGYNFAKGHSVVVNYFDIFYKDILTVARDSVFTPVDYRNMEQVGTHGIEAEYKLVKPAYNLGLNLSYYKIYNNSLKLFEVPDKENTLLGNPSIRINAFAGVKMNRKISINPSVSFFGYRYGYISIKPVMTSNGYELRNVVKKFSPRFIFNLNICTDDLFIDKLQLDLGIRNLLNTDFEYIQPFMGYSAPIPAATSSIVLRAYYEFSF